MRAPPPSAPGRRVPRHGAALRHLLRGPPALAHRRAPCAGQRTSLVGYVAVCDSPTEVRRDIVVALRGTCTVLEWAENVRAGLVPATDDSAAASPDAKVESGFWNLYKEPPWWRRRPRSRQQAADEEMRGPAARVRVAMATELQVSPARGRDR
ncbi:hypothetical protein ACP70R_035214 [Stipagrostis hirtigluma subsp. patula]